MLPQAAHRDQLTLRDAWDQGQVHEVPVHVGLHYCYHYSFLQLRIEKQLHPRILKTRTYSHKSHCEYCEIIQLGMRENEGEGQ